MAVLVWRKMQSVFGWMGDTFPAKGHLKPKQLIVKIENT